MTSLDDRLIALKERFLERAREDLRTIELIDTAGTLDENDREVLVGISHKLAGLSGTLGFGEVSQAASALETALLDRTADQLTEAKVAALKQVLLGLPVKLTG